MAALRWTRAGDVGGTKWEEGFAKGGGVQQVESKETGARGWGFWFGLTAGSTPGWAVCLKLRGRTGDWAFPRRHLGPDFGFWRAKYGLLLESAGADWVGGTGRLWG